MTERQYPSDCERIAAGVQRALRVSRDNIFPNGELMPVSLPELALVPYVGWVGSRFTGTVIIGKNPGGGRDAQVDVEQADRNVANALLSLRDAAKNDVSDALNAVYATFLAQAPTIGIGTLLGRVLNALGEEREQVAFLNLCPFRTRHDADFGSAAFRRCVELVLVPLLDALEPDTVVLLGGVAAKAQPHLTAKWIYRLKRRINDRQLHPEAAVVLQKIQFAREERRLHRQSTSTDPVLRAR